MYIWAQLYLQGCSKHVENGQAFVCKMQYKIIFQSQLIDALIKLQLQAGGYSESYCVLFYTITINHSNG